MTLHVGVVCTLDGIRFIAVESSADRLLGMLSHYVRQRAPTMLWPGDARRVRELIASGSVEPALELYFRRVGERWDREYLHRQAVELNPHHGDGE